MPRASDFTTYLKEAVMRHDIYVLGGQGEIVTDIMPKLPYKETGTNLVNVLTTLSNRLREGYDPTVMRAYDCSGLGTAFFLKEGLIKYDMTADGIYGICTPIKMGDLKEGDAVFQEGTKIVDGKQIKYKHHIGYYIGDNLVIEAKGRAYGVVQTHLTNSGYKWTHAARPNWWIPEDIVIKRKLKYDSTSIMKGEDVKAIQTKLKELGFTEVGKVDGEFGQKTETAVTNFQTNYKVKLPRKLGVVGKTTVLALGFKWEG